MRTEPLHLQTTGISTKVQGSTDSGSPCIRAIQAVPGFERLTGVFVVLDQCWYPLLTEMFADT